MTMGVSQASAAPASSRAATATARVSPVASSRLASRSTRGWPAGGSTATGVPRTTCVRLGSASSSAVPAPKPVASTVIGGSAPHREARAARRAAPGRGGQLDGHVEAPHRCAGQELHHRRRRVGQEAVGGADHARTGGHRAGRHLVDAEDLEGRGHPDDVDDGVDAAQLVEVHGLGRAPVDASLDLGQRGEGGAGPGQHPLGQPGLLEEARDVGPGADHRRGRRVHHHAGGTDAVALGGLDLEGPPRHRDPLDEGPHLVGVGAGVDEGAERHVPGDAGEAVEPGERAPAVSHGRRGHRGVGPRRRRRRSRCRCPRR